MTVLNILQYPDPKLRKKAKAVEDFGDETQRMIDDMIDTLYHQECCAGLSAVQMGIPYRITVIDFSQEKNRLLILVNPQISNPRGGVTNTSEGCMSVGLGLNISAKVKRSRQVYVKARDRHGKVLKFEADGFLAKCIQHEIDHLDGILFLDHLSVIKRSAIEFRLWLDRTFNQSRGC